MVVAYKMYFVPGNNPRTVPMPRKLPKIGYRVWNRFNHTLASNILQFSVIRSLPIPINVEKLDEGGGIAETLMQRKAKLHKSCRNKFSNMKLKRADKRKIQEEPESPQRSKFYKGVFWRNYFQNRKKLLFLWTFLGNAP